MAKLTDTELIGKYIGRKIRLFMDDKGVSVLDVANKMGIKSPSISTILSGRTYSSNLDRYEKIAIAAGMTKSMFESVVMEARRNELESSVPQELGKKPTDPDVAFRAKHGISDEEKWKLVQGFIDMITKSDK